MRRTSKLGVARETLVALGQVHGGGFTDFCSGGSIEKTVYYPQPTHTCTSGCPIAT